MYLECYVRGKGWKLERGRVITGESEQVVRSQIIEDLVYHAKVVSTF